LELIAAGTIVDREVLNRLQIEMDAFHPCQFGVEPADHLGRVDMAFRKWFEIDLNASAVERYIGPVYSNE
jgi:hypothetical protein